MSSARSRSAHAQSVKHIFTRRILGCSFFSGGYIRFRIRIGSNHCRGIRPLTYHYHYWNGYRTNGIFISWSYSFELLGYPWQKRLYSKQIFWPSSYIIQHLIGEDDHLVTLQYSRIWRVIRQLIHQYFTDSMCDKEHVHLQHAGGVQMLWGFIVDPKNHRSILDGIRAVSWPVLVCRRFTSQYLLLFLLIVIVCGVSIPSIKSSYMAHRINYFHYRRGGSTWSFFSNS